LPSVIEERSGSSLKYENVLPEKTVPNPPKPVPGSTRLLEACDLNVFLLISSYAEREHNLIEPPIKTRECKGVSFYPGFSS
jgi:hypothetical protein